MAQENDKAGKGAAATPTLTAAQKAVATRKARREQIGTLNDRQKFVIRTARAAAQAAQLIVDRVERGDDVSAEAVEACSTLAGKVGSLLLG